MKVLTIKQPWATLITKGYKEYEFRTWRTKYRGKLLIHAGKSIDKEAIERFKYLNLEYPLGCIISEVELTDCVLVTDEFSNMMYSKDENIYKGLISLREKNKYGFKIENVNEIAPIYLKGKLGLWNYE